MANGCEKTRDRLQQLREVLAGRRSLLIVMQTYPDPDALASAAALRAIALAISDVRSTVTSNGIVGRAENRALARYLQLPYRHLEEIQPANFDIVAMVDTQPGTGANGLPENVDVQVVIDHHPIGGRTRSARFIDVRSGCGSCSSILYGYLRESEVEIETSLATALLYGIRSDTQELGREASRADIDAIVGLYPLANMRMLGRIQNASTPRSWFHMLGAALASARVYDHAIVSRIGEIDIPDIVGEIADMALRDETVDWTLCYGYFGNQMLLSVRAAGDGGDAGDVMRKIVSGKGTGGGHRAMAGGQIVVEGTTNKDRHRLENLVKNRFLRALGISARKGEKLVGSRALSGSPKRD